MGRVCVCVCRYKLGYGVVGGWRRKCEKSGSVGYWVWERKMCVWEERECGDRRSVGHKLWALGVWADYCEDEGELTKFISKRRTVEKVH